MKAPAADARPYGWAVEFPLSAPPEKRLVTFIGNADDHDLAYATNYATKLHGLLVPVERREVHQP
jgi:hypothetical protein